MMRAGMMQAEAPGNGGDYRFNVSNSQLQGSGDNLSEQSGPLLQVEDIQAAVGGEPAVLESVMRATSSSIFRTSGSGLS